MDDLEHDEEWYHAVFSLMRNRGMSSRSIHEWFEEFHKAIKSSRLRHPKIDSLGLIVVSGISQAIGLKRTKYRHGDRND